MLYGFVAQQVERLMVNQDVAGSSPAVPTTSKHRLMANLGAYILAFQVRVLVLRPAGHAALALVSMRTALRVSQMQKSM